MGKLTSQGVNFIKLSLIVSSLIIVAAYAHLENSSRNTIKIGNVMCYTRTNPLNRQGSPPWHNACSTQNPVSSFLKNSISVQTPFPVNRYESSYSVKQNLVSRNKRSSEYQWALYGDMGSQRSMRISRSPYGPQEKNPSDNRALKVTDYNLSGYLFDIDWNTQGIRNSLSRISGTFKEMRDYYNQKFSALTVNGDEFRKWLPRFENLTYYNTAVNEKDMPKLSKYLLNISQYLEYFSCALEQMVYEEIRRPSSEILKSNLDVLSSDLIQVQCHTELLAELVENIEQEMINIDHLSIVIAPDSSYGRIRQVLKSIVGLKLLKSPLEEMLGKSSNPANRSHVPREVMQIETRALDFCCRDERNISILKELEIFLNYYWSTWRKIRNDMNGPEEETRFPS